MTKKILSLVLVIAVVLSCACMTFANAADLTQTTGNVNMRSGAGMNYGVKLVIPKGTKVEYTDTEEDARGRTWFKVTYNGKTGWISSNYTTDAEKYGGHIWNGTEGTSGTVYTTGKLNLRKSASTSAKILKTIPNGTKVSYSKVAFDDRGIRWFYVKYNGTYGWISSVYTSKSEEALIKQDKKSSSSSSSSSSSTVTTTGKCVLRGEPDKTSAYLKTIPNGTKLEYLGNSEKDDRDVTWYNVKYNGTKGWVSSKYSKRS